MSSYKIPSAGVKNVRFVRTARTFGFDDNILLVAYAREITGIDVFR